MQELYQQTSSRSFIPVERNGKTIDIETDFDFESAMLIGDTLVFITDENGYANFAEEMEGMSGIDGFRMCLLGRCNDEGRRQHDSNSLITKNASLDHLRDRVGQYYDFDELCEEAGKAGFLIARINEVCGVPPYASYEMSDDAEHGLLWMSPEDAAKHGLDQDGFNEWAKRIVANLDECFNGNVKSVGSFDASTVLQTLEDGETFRLHSDNMDWTHPLYGLREVDYVIQHEFSETSNSPRM